MQNLMDALKEIMDRAEARIEQRKAIRLNHLKAWHAGVDGVGNPDQPMARALFDNRALGSILGMRPPDGGVILMVDETWIPGNLDEMAAVAKSMTNNGAVNEPCGWCNQAKPVGQWCSNKRCKSQRLRRQE